MLLVIAPLVYLSGIGILGEIGLDLDVGGEKIGALPQSPSGPSA
jgi:hypothetical protein